MASRVAIKVALEPELDSGKLRAAAAAMANVPVPKMKIVDAESANAEIAKIQSKLTELNSSGQGSSAAATKLKAELAEAKNEAAKLAGEAKNVGSNLGSASGGAISGLVAKFKEGQAQASAGGGMFGDIASKIGSIASPAGLVTSAVGALAAGFAHTISIGKEFETGLQSVSAVTGLVGEPLADLGDRARVLAKTFGGDATTQLSAFQGVLSKFGADLAQSPAELTKVSTSINLLAKAGGFDASQAMETLANSQLQFGANSLDAAGKAEQSAQFINVLAASARVGAAEIPQVGQAVLVAGVAAKSSKVSFEETNAAIQVLAAGGKVGAEAGTALRNVLGKLGEGRFMSKDSAEGLQAAGVDMSKLSDKTIPLSERLGELKKIMNDSALVTKVFGTENSSAASILIDNASTLKDWTEQMTGTEDATTQASKNMNTFSERMSRAKASIDDLFIGAFTKIGPILNSLSDNMGLIAKVVFSAGLAFGVYSVVMNASAIATGIATAVTYLHTVATNIATVATIAFNAVLAISPIGLFAIALGAAVGAYALFHKSSQESAESQLAEAEAAKEVIQKRIEDNNAKQASAIATQGLVKKYEELASKAQLTKSEEKELHSIQDKLDRQYPDLIDQTKTFKENLSGVEEIGKKTTTALQGLVNQNSELQKQLADSSVKISFSKRNVAIEELKTAFSEVGSVWVHTVEDDFKNLHFDGQIFASNTEAQLNQVEAKMREFINKNQERIGDSKAFLAIEAATTKVIEAQRQALIASGVIKKDEADTQKKSDADADAAAKTKKEKGDTLFQQQKKLFENAKEKILLDQQAIALAIEQAATDKGRALTDAEKLSIKRSELAAQEQILAKAREILSVSGEGADIKTTLSLDKKEVVTAQTDVKKTVLDIQKSIGNLKMAIVPEASKADDKFYKDFEASIKDQVSRITGLISVDELINTKSSDGIKAQIADLVSVSKDLHDSAIEAMMKGNVGLANNINKFADETLKQAQKLQEELTKNTAAALVKRREIEIASMRDGVEKEHAQKKLSLDNEYQQAIANALLINAKTEDIERNHQAALARLDLEYAESTRAEKLKIAIAALSSEGARSIADKLKSLQEERDALLKNTEATEADKAAIRLRYDKQISDILNGNDSDTKKLREDLSKQETDLGASFKKREISYEEYLTKLAELKTKQNELTQRATDTKDAAVTVGLSVDTKGAADQLNKVTTDAKAKIPKALEEVGSDAATKFLSGLATGENAATSFKSIVEDSTNGIAAAYKQSASQGMNAFKSLELGAGDSMLALAAAGVGSFIAVGIESKKSAVAIKATYDGLKTAVADKFQAMADAVDTSFSTAGKSAIETIQNVGTALSLQFAGMMVAGKNAGDSLARVTQSLSVTLDKSSKIQMDNAKSNFAFTMKTEDEKKAAIADVEKQKQVILAKSDAERTTADKQKLQDLDGQLSEMKDSTGAAFTAMGQASILAFGSMVAGGASAMDSLKKILIENVSVVLQTYIAPMIASFLSFLGPFAMPAALAAVALVKGLFSNAIQGFRHGGKVSGKERMIRINEDGEEFVVNHRATSKNFAALDYINKHNITVEEYAYMKSANKGGSLRDLPTLTEIHNHVAIQTADLRSEMSEMNDTLARHESHLAAIARGILTRKPKDEVTITARPTRHFTADIRKEQRSRARRGE